MGELRARYAYSGNNVEYIGEARPDVAPHQAGWRIKKYFFSGNLSTGYAWANGTDLFDKIWNDRATYTYNAI